MCAHTVSLYKKSKLFMQIEQQSKGKDGNKINIFLVGWKKNVYDIWIKQLPENKTSKLSLDERNLEMQ